MSNSKKSSVRRPLSENDGSCSRCKSACQRLSCSRCARDNTTSRSCCRACSCKWPRLQEPPLQEPPLHIATSSRMAYPLACSGRGEPRQVSGQGRADPAYNEEEESVMVLGWSCPRCTYANSGARTDCEMCCTTFSRLPSLTNPHSPVIDVDALPNRKDDEQSLLQRPSRRPDDEAVTQACAWKCIECTFDNVTSLKCAMCGAKRPVRMHQRNNDGLAIVSEHMQPSTSGLGNNLRSPKDLPQRAEAVLVGVSDKQSNVSMEILTKMSREEPVRLVRNTAPFHCLICLSVCSTGEGVVLQECLHEFCRSCLRGYIIHSTEPSIKCPYADAVYSCSEEILDREVKAMAPEHYDAYLQRGLSAAEACEPNSFHCTTPNCAGWCIYEDKVNFFRCTLCRHVNCLTCKVIHEGRNCKEYQDDLKARAVHDDSARATQVYIHNLLASGEAMKCPGCQVVLQKKDGCDLMICSVCKTEICWATKMARWGPKGRGDTSGGCQCTFEKRCHRACRGCH